MNYTNREGKLYKQTMEKANYINRNGKGDLDKHTMEKVTYWKSCSKVQLCSQILTPTGSNRPLLILHHSILLYTYKFYDAWLPNLVQNQCLRGANLIPMSGSYEAMGSDGDQLDVLVHE